MVRAAENPRAEQVHGEAGTGHPYSFLVANRLRRYQALDRPDHHQARHAKQQDGAGVAREDFHLPGPEREARVTREVARVVPYRDLRCGGQKDREINK